MKFRFLPVHIRHLWNATGVVFDTRLLLKPSTGVVFDTRGPVFGNPQVSFMDHSYIATHYTLPKGQLQVLGTSEAAR